MIARDARHRDTLSPMSRTSSARSVLTCVLLVLTGAGCESYSSPANLPTVEMKVGTKTYTIEIAADDAARQRGLMMRDSIPKNWGMIFVFPDEAERGFWMKNTRIPLDIIYVDAAGKVVSIHTMKPYDLESTVSAGPAKYAIELNAGQAAEAGVKPGDQLDIPGPARTTDR